MSGGLVLTPSLPVTRYVAEGETLTVSTLLSEFPASVSNKGYYARVSDLYGSVDDIMRCRFDGVNYRWVPQRESFVGTTAASGGNVSIIPLMTPPTLRLTTTSLTNHMTVQASTVNAYLGQRARIIMPPTLTLGLYTAQITGLIGSNITLLAGKTNDIEYGSTGWFQST